MMADLPIPTNVHGLEAITFYPNRLFLDNDGNMVHTRAILVRDRIQPDGTRNISVYIKHSTYQDSLEGQEYINARCYG